MNAPDGWTVLEATLFGAAVKRARDARAAGQAGPRPDILPDINEHYREAVFLAQGEEQAVALAVEHVDTLRSLCDSNGALAKCAEYRRHYPSAIWLALVEAETRVMQGDLTRLEDDLAEVEHLAETRTLPRVQAALATRLAGLAAHHRGDFAFARSRLEDARDRYQRLKLAGGVTEVERDLRRLRARVEVAVVNESVPVKDLSTAAALAWSEELRMAGRYESALQVIREIQKGPVDPALDYAVREAEVRLLWLLQDKDQAKGLLRELYRAADRSAQPDLNRDAAARLDPKRSEPTQVPVSADRRLQHVRRLVDADRLEEAERHLGALAGSSDTRHEAEWHLTAGELALAFGLRRGETAAVGQAIKHLEHAARLAERGTLRPIRIAAQRLLVQGHKARHDRPAAVRAAALARAGEDYIAGLQDTDETRIRMYTDVVTEFDEQVKVAHEDVTRGLPFAVASVAIAIEAGRGAAILPRIVPGDDRHDFRKLPAAGDGSGAWRWIRQALRGLPWDQTVWMLHVTPTGLHHVLADHWRLRYQFVTQGRNDFRKPVDKLREYWNLSGKDLVNRAAEFCGHLDDLAALIGLDEVLAQLPRRTRRLAIVAGDELSEIPFAALPCPGVRPRTRDRLGHRFALSDLPCLAVRQPLRRQSRGRRSPGTRVLQPSAPTTKSPHSDELHPLTAVEPGPDRQVFSRHEATPAAFQDALSSGVGTVRIDSHGTFGNEHEGPALFLWPVRREQDQCSVGDLRPADLDGRHATTTTVGTLVVGACQSGMATRRGRDERIGFVRSGLLAGAPAVLAARWNAEDSTAARLLEDFEDGLRYLPRDLALQRAMIRTARCGPNDARGVVLCGAWTLYGDPGLQTRRGLLGRWLIRSWDAVTRLPNGRSTPGVHS